VHARRNFSVPSNYGRWSHLCDTARVFFGVSLLCPGCRKPYPDRRDMCVSMLIDALQSLGQNERETAENGQELSEDGTPGARRGASFPLWKVGVM
jgi:hypothetical protein